MCIRVPGHTERGNLRLHASDTSVCVHYLSLSCNHAFRSINSIIRPETSCVPFIKSQKDLSTLVRFLLQKSNISFAVGVCADIYVVGFFCFAFL